MSKYDPKDLNGVMPAMITSINKDETINKEGLRKIINQKFSEKQILNFKSFFEYTLIFLIIYYVLF